eukprot:364586-Chlamydomonas_euryale.AAC.23
MGRGVPTCYMELHAHPIQVAQKHAFLVGSPWTLDSGSDLAPGLELWHVGPRLLCEHRIRWQNART